jgi:hypothetical protein
MFPKFDLSVIQRFKRYPNYLAWIKIWSGKLQKLYSLNASILMNFRYQCMSFCFVSEIKCEQVKKSVKFVLCYTKIHLGEILIISYFSLASYWRNRRGKKASGQFIIKVYLDALLKALKLSKRNLYKDAAVQLLPSF